MSCFKNKIHGKAIIRMHRLKKPGVAAGLGSEGTIFSLLVFHKR